MALHGAATSDRLWQLYVEMLPLSSSRELKRVAIRRSGEVQCELKAHGHEVKLIAPQFVKPYVKANQIDAADAEATCEAVARSNIRFVPIILPILLSAYAHKRTYLTLITPENANEQRAMVHRGAR